MTGNGNRAAVARLCVPGVHLGLEECTKVRAEGAEILTAAAATSDQQEQEAAQGFAAGSPLHTHKPTLYQIRDRLTGVELRIATTALALSAHNFVHARPKRTDDPAIE